MKFENEFAAFKMTDIIVRSLNNELSDEENAALQEWLKANPVNQNLYEEISNKESRSAALSSIDRYPSKAAFLKFEKQVKKKTVKLWPRIAAAASILLVLGLGTLFYTSRNSHLDSQQHFSVKHDIDPGKNVATLTLANGKVINLSDDKTGIVIDATKLTYNDGTKINVVANAKANQYQTIATPRGGTYQIRLPDGTMVWLNADSRLSFPVKFSGNARKVELIGEGYFEVAKNKAMPFKVKTNRQEIEVLGTHFNINSYTDEATTKTTLLEGSVRVAALNKMSSEPVVLKPGEQSVLTVDDLKVRQIDTEAAVSWKNGYFRFDDEDLESIMLKVARWYNVDVLFKNEKLKKEPFAGIIKRDTKISELLKMLAAAGEVKFEIENNQIIVMDKK